MVFLKKKRFTKVNFICYLTLSSIIFFCFGLILSTNLGIRRSAVTGESMRPTLHDGTKILMLNPKYKKIKRGDIISKYVDDKTHYVKRVIGLPNEEVRIEGINVYINGQLLEEPYAFYEDWILELDKKGKVQDREGTWKLKADEYFIMGDNRLRSMDSRDFGPVAKKEILEIVLHIFSVKAPQ